MTTYYEERGKCFLFLLLCFYICCGCSGISLRCIIACLENDDAFIFYVGFGRLIAFAILEFCYSEFGMILAHVYDDLNISLMDKLN